MRIKEGEKKIENRWERTKNKQSKEASLSL
jgi:hypothetical protein